jgi:hypothetical protein
MYQRTAVRKATAAQLRPLLLSARPAKVSKAGRVKLFGNEYWHPALSPRIGKRVVLHFDPDALANGVHVYTTDGAFVCTADAPIVVGFKDKQAAERINKERKARERRRREFVRDVRDSAPTLPDRDRSLLDYPGARLPKPEPGAVIPLRTKAGKSPAESVGQSPAQVIDHPTIAKRQRAR